MHTRLCTEANRTQHVCKSSHKPSAWAAGGVCWPGGSVLYSDNHRPQMPGCSPPFALAVRLLPLFLRRHLNSISGYKVPNCAPEIFNFDQLANTLFYGSKQRRLHYLVHFSEMVAPRATKQWNFKLLLPTWFGWTHRMFCLQGDELLPDCFLVGLIFKLKSF